MGWGVEMGLGAGDGGSLAGVGRCRVPAREWAPRGLGATRPQGWLAGRRGRLEAGGRGGGRAGAGGGGHPPRTPVRPGPLAAKRPPARGVVRVVPKPFAHLGCRWARSLREGPWRARWVL